MVRRFQISLRRLLIIAPIVAMILGGGGYFVRERELARARESVINKMTFLGFGIHSFNDSYRRLPKANELDRAGHSLSSWRFMLMPYWDCQQSGFDGNTSQPWTSPINSQWRTAIAPSIVSFTRRTLNSPNARDTNVFAITGPGTAFDPQKTVTAEQLVAAPAASQVILFVEVRNSKTHWMQPGDFDIRTMPHTINDPAGEGISGTCPGCFCVCFATTEAWMLRNDTPFDKLALFFTIEGARKHDREVELGPYRVK